MNQKEADTTHSAKDSASQRVLQDSETHFVCGAYRHGVQRKHYIILQIKAQSQVEQTAVYSSLFLPLVKGMCSFYSVSHNA